MTSTPDRTSEKVYVVGGTAIKEDLFDLAVRFAAEQTIPDARFDVSRLIKLDNDGEWDMPIQSFVKNGRLPFPSTEISYSTKRLERTFWKNPLVSQARRIVGTFGDYTDNDRTRDAMSSFMLQSPFITTPELRDSIASGPTSLCALWADHGESVFPLGYILYIGERGEYVTLSSVLLNTSVLGIHPSDATPEQYERIRAGSQTTIEWLVWPIWYAFQLLNCKNVEVEKLLTSRQERRRRERLSSKAFVPDYRIVITVPGKKSYTVAGPRKQGEAYIDAHMVRGHFAEYTEERKLFGKYSGRYWIPAHVRGKRDPDDADPKAKDYLVRPDEVAA